jgi:hypothetical protein
VNRPDFPGGSISGEDGVMGRRNNGTAKIASEWKASANILVSKAKSSAENCLVLSQRKIKTPKIRIAVIKNTYMRALCETSIIVGRKVSVATKAKLSFEGKNRLPR